MIDCKSHSDGKHRFSHHVVDRMAKQCACGLVVPPLERRSKTPLLEELRGWKELPGMSDDAIYKLYVMRRAADEIEKLRRTNEELVNFIRTSAINATKFAASYDPERRA